MRKALIASAAALSIVLGLAAAQSRTTTTSAAGPVIREPCSVVYRVGDNVMNASGRLVEVTPDWLILDHADRREWYSRRHVVKTWQSK